MDIATGSGGVSGEIGFYSLSVLTISNNNLQGVISSDFASVSTLRTLDLTNNNLSGVCCYVPLVPLLIVLSANSR